MKNGHPFLGWHVGFTASFTTMTRFFGGNSISNVDLVPIIYGRVEEFFKANKKK